MTSPAISVDDPERLRRSPKQYMSGQFSSSRQQVAPVDFTLSRRRAATPRYCLTCRGPWVREIRGGPVVRHALDCVSVP